ncbi:MAG: TonB-dependent receptor, partial [Anaerolineaceae bacterium]
AAGGGFDPIGVTSPSGRQDITGHLDDDLSWTKGAHQLHIGGEFRKAQVHDFYQTGKRGTIYFDGSQGPWANDKTITDPNLRYLADFLAGDFDPNYSNIVLGDSTRLVYVNTFALFAQDAWQINKRLNLNFGVRYDYEGPVHSGEPNLSIFDPTKASGLAVVGQDVSNIYQKFWGGVSPRVGFAYRLDSNGKSVLRGGYGFYGDSVFMKSILQNNGAQNISVFGPEFNPAGSQKVAQAAGLNNTVIAAGQPIYQTYAAALAGQGTVAISTFDKSFRPSYTQTYDLNIQHSFSSNVIWQAGYVGTQGIHLMGLFDINPETAGSANLANPNVTRPYYKQFSNFTTIDEARSNLGSNYNSLQTTLRVQNYHGLTSQLGYTWAHALDYETGEIPYVAQNPLNEKGEYGNADFDVRQTLTGYLNYTVPHFAGPSRLVDGWEINSGYSFHGGTPYTVTSNSNPSNNGESADRAVQVIKNPTAGVDHSIQNGIVQWFNPNAFVDAAQGTYSPTRRNQNFSPGYSAVDIAILKNTKVNERVKAQFRADIFNAFNHVNLAPVGFDFASEAGVIGSTLGPYLGNPGIGPGEPRCAQFSLKMLF